MITKADFNAKLSGLNRKITKNKTDHLLIQNELNKLKTFDSSYFGKSHFEEDGAQNYLLFKAISRYFRINGKYILSWTSKGLSDETIILYATSDNNSLTPLIDHYGAGIR